MGELKGQIIGGSIQELLMRQKSGTQLEIGELLVAESESGRMLLKVIDLRYASQISSQNLELISGMQIEEETDTEFMEPELRNYRIAILKPLISLAGKSSKLSKSLPKFFSRVNQVRAEDLDFLTKPKNPLFVGNLRSGSSGLNVPLYLPAEKVLSHHILIPATTGRGKSNLTSCMLWDCIGKDFSGILVLDPHDEYYGRNSMGLKDHPDADMVAYYTPKNVPAGAKTLKISLDSLKPDHFRGAIDWSDPQAEAIYGYYREFRESWIEAILMEKELSNLKDFSEATIGVVRRRLQGILRAKKTKDGIRCEGVFSTESGKHTITDIAAELESGKVVIVDTSSFEGSLEILIGSMVSSEIFKRYRKYKGEGSLELKPVISIVLEEAPRVLGKDVLERGSNIFSQIAREGRKFKVGLWAITQLPSLIPRQILANMNTKIILGLEMAPERQAVIDSAAQDLSRDERAIASLDVGEAIVTSNFTRFATPIKIPRFEDLAKQTQNESVARKHSVELAGLK